MKTLIRVTTFALSLLFGIISTQIEIIDIPTKEVTDQKIRSVNVSNIPIPRFRLLEKGFNDYQFQSSGGEKRFDMVEILAFCIIL